MFYSKSFTVLACIFRLLIYFEFYVWCKLGIQLHSFGSEHLVVPAPFVEETVLTPLNGLDILSKISWLAVDVWVYFWTLFCSVNFFFFFSISSIPLIYMFILMPVPHCFDYCSFVISFEIGKCESSCFVLFQDCFGYSESLAILHRTRRNNTKICMESQ